MVMPFCPHTQNKWLKKNLNLGQANVVIAGHSVASYLQKYIFD